MGPNNSKNLKLSLLNSVNTIINSEIIPIILNISNTRDLLRWVVVNKIWKKLCLDILHQRAPPNLWNPKKKMNEITGEPFKVAILGSDFVGKSATVIQLTSGVFLERYDPTIEDTYRKRIAIRHKKKKFLCHAGHFRYY